MSQESGSQLGPYTVVGLLGEGGMGQVYRAKDSRLDREVAIKVLPSGVASDASALARFQREAQAVAALSHPNILAIHDIGQEGDQHYVVYELIAGETLRERIDGDGLDRRKAIELGYQIARGLGAAHSKGIVHRDLKPDNVMVSPDGQAKILDFGLSTWEEDGGTAAAETRTSLTHPGTVMGTVGYMAPEQVRGQAADSRSDIFSFGALLFEMLTGGRAFDRETTAETMTAILREAPGEPETPLPPALRAILLRCLEKRAEERFHSADDLAFALESSLRDSSSTFSGSFAQAPESEPSKRRRWSLFIPVIALAALLLGTFLGSQFLSSRSQQLPPAEYKLRRLTFEGGLEIHPSLAPHGRTFTYASPTNGLGRILSRRVGGEASIELAEGALPAYSPDGEQIAFVHRDGGVWIMGATGESPRRLTDDGFNPAWSPDGKEIVTSCEYISNPDGRQQRCGLTRVVVATGAASAISMDVEDAVQPNWSPNGFRIAFWGLPKGSGDRTLYTVPAEGGEAIPLTDDSYFNWNPVWSKDGEWLYFASDRGGPMNIWRMPIDEATGQSLGPSQSVTQSTSDVGMFSVADDGSIAFSASTSYMTLRRLPFDFDTGKISGPGEVIIEGSRDTSQPVLSPNGRFIAFTSVDITEDLYILERESGQIRRLTNDVFRDRGTQWSGDSQLIFFSDRSGRYEAWRIGIDGSDLEQLTSTTAPQGFTPLPKPDGSAIIFHLDRGAHLFELAGEYPLSESTPLPLFSAEQKFLARSWSPDSRRVIGQVTNRSGFVIYDSENQETPYQEFVEDRGAVFWFEPDRIAIGLGARLRVYDANTRELLYETTLESGQLFGFGKDAIYSVEHQARVDIWQLSQSERAPN